MPGPLRLTQPALLGSRFRLVLGQLPLRLGEGALVGAGAVVTADVAAGETVDVDLELDTQPRELELPADFKKALDRDARAKRFFEGLSNSKKQRLVLPVANGKTPETRQRNIDKAMSVLREGRA